MHGDAGKDEDDQNAEPRQSQGLRVVHRTGRYRETGLAIDVIPESHATRYDTNIHPSVSVKVLNKYSLLWGEMRATKEKN